MVTIKVEMSQVEYDLASRKKGTQTWREALFNGLGMAFDARVKGRPRYASDDLDDIFDESLKASTAGKIPKQSVGLDGVSSDVVDRDKRRVKRHGTG